MSIDLALPFQDLKEGVTLCAWGNHIDAPDATSLFDDSEIPHSSIDPHSFPLDNPALTR